MPGDELQNRWQELQRQQRFNEARTMLIAAFAVWMLPDIGNSFLDLNSMVIAISSVLAAAAWVLILGMFSRLTLKGYDFHSGEFDDSRDAMRATEFLYSLKSRYQRTSTVLSCMSIVITTLTSGAAPFLRF